MNSDDRHQAVEAARTGAGLSVQQLWLRYLALGGSGDAFDVDGYLQGLVPLEDFQQDVLAQAVNEALEELCSSLRVPLSGSDGDRSVDGALTEVIDQLLARRPDASRRMTPPLTAAPPGDEGRSSGRPPGAPPHP